MMRRLLNKKAFTLVETLLAISIIAAIALPLMTVFLQSVKTDQAAKSVLNANYISQSYMENLDATTYPAALANLPDHLETGGYYLSAKIEPYGTAGTLFHQACAYTHLVFYDGGGMLAVMPDGQWHMFETHPGNVSLNLSGGVYIFTGADTTLTGSCHAPYCALLINAMQKPSGSECGVTLGDSCKAVLYCKAFDSDDISITGSSETYSNIISGDASLVHVTTYVYDSTASTVPVAQTESYINLKNW